WVSDCREALLLSLRAFRWCRTDVVLLSSDPTKLARAWPPGVHRSLNTAYAPSGDAAGAVARWTEASVLSSARESGGPTTPSSGSRTVPSPIHRTPAVAKPSGLNTRQMA